MGASSVIAVTEGTNPPEHRNCRIANPATLFETSLFKTHWGRVTHICVDNLTIIGSDNGLSPGRRQAIIWTSAGILLIETLGTIFSENLIEIHTFSFKKMYLKMSGKWQPFCLVLNVLKSVTWFSLRNIIYMTPQPQWSQLGDWLLMLRYYLAPGHLQLYLASTSATALMSQGCPNVMSNDI